MSEVFVFLLVFGFPIVATVAACRLNLLGKAVSAVPVIAVASLVPAIIVFVVTQQADSITRAASIYVSPVFIIYGLFASVFTASFCRRR